MSLAEVVSGHRIVVSAGSGGVGKTTVAASLSLWGALNGRRTVALTIDPARRLATSLGLETLGSVPREIPAQLFRDQSLDAAIRAGERGVGSVVRGGRPGRLERVGLDDAR